MTEHGDRPDVLNQEYADCFYWLDGRLDKAKQALNKAYEKSQTVSVNLCLALIADDEKDPGRRDDASGSHRRA